MLSLQNLIKIFGKYILAIVVLFIINTNCLANIIPQTSDDIPFNSIGLYQTDRRITVYSEPDSTSKVILDKEVVYKNLIGIKKDNIFGVLIPQKELGYLFAVDTSDDENWVKVIYDKAENKTGWVYKNDVFQFMPWIDFINIYGRKYGVNKFKQSVNFNNIYSNPDEKSQILGSLSHPKVIRLTAIEGNWFLITALDMSGETITGYVIWRTTDGKILMFPNIK